MLIRSLSLAALFACALPSVAAQFQAGELLVDQPWSRELPPNAPAGAAYFSLHNQGSESDRLIGASTPRAEHSELHTHVHQDGLMKMTQIPAVELPAGAQVVFQPGGNHVMLFGLSQPLRAGEQFPLTLEFEKAGTLEVQVEVRSADGQAVPMPHGQHHGH